MELDKRKEVLLEAIVDSYVVRAEPVASEYLASMGSLGVRSATIRNEMADLTELGYLRQPHTSAGRVPSTLGYRYYVDHLMRWQRLSTAAARGVREIYQLSQGDIEQLLTQTCRLLSSLTGYTSMAAPPSGEEAAIRSVHLVHMGGARALLVVVLNNGQVVHRFSDLGRVFSPHEVTLLSNALDEMLRGKRAAVAPAAIVVPAELAGYEEPLRCLARMVLRSIEEEEDGTHLEGASRILEQPEFRDAERVEPLIRLLEKRRSLFEQLRSMIASGNLTMVIGEENPHEPLRECSIVMARYGAGDRMSGWIGVLGPTRMHYQQAAPAVEFVARSLTEAFARMGLV